MTLWPPVANKRTPLQVRIVPGMAIGRETVDGYRFSAFWLRSSVVSVLISIISDMSFIPGLHINGFLGKGVEEGACSVHSKHRPGTAVPPGTVRFSLLL